MESSGEGRRLPTAIEMLGSDPDMLAGGMAVLAETVADVWEGEQDKGWSLLANRSKEYSSLLQQAIKAYNTAADDDKADARRELHQSMGRYLVIELVVKAILDRRIPNEPAADAG